MIRLARSFALILFALLTAGTLLAQEPPPEPEPGSEPGIWIADASGELRPVPPVAATFLREEKDAGGELVLLIERFEGTATAALSSGQLGVTRVRQALAQNGVPAQRVSSELAYVEPRYRPLILTGSRPFPERLGFDAAYLVKVRLAKGWDPGRLIDAAFGAGATRVLSLR